MAFVSANNLPDETLLRLAKNFISSIASFDSTGYTDPALSTRSSLNGSIIENTFQKAETSIKSVSQKVIDEINRSADASIQKLVANVAAAEKELDQLNKEQQKQIEAYKQSLNNSQRQATGRQTAASQAVNEASILLSHPSSKQLQQRINDAQLKLEAAQQEKDRVTLETEKRRQEQIEQELKHRQELLEIVRQNKWKTADIAEKLRVIKDIELNAQKQIEELEVLKQEKGLTDEQENQLEELIKIRDNSNKRYFEVRKTQISELSRQERLARYKSEAQQIESERRAQKKLNDLENQDNEEKRRKREKEINQSAKMQLSKAAELYGIGILGMQSADTNLTKITSGISTFSDIVAGGPSGISAALDSVLGSASPIIAAIQSILKIVGSINRIVDQGVQKSVSLQSGYMGQINARLQRFSGDSQNYYEEMLNWQNKNALTQDGFGLYITDVSTFIDKSKYIENLNNLVQSGIAYNAEERAAIQTLSDRMVTTFNAMDATLVRLTRIQERDLTYSALGQESLLNKFLVSTFADTSYLSDVYDSVSATLLDATAKMTADQAASFSYEVQKWLGSLYSKGLSSEGVQELAKGITYLATGDVSNLTSNQSLQYIYATAAERAGLSYADILVQGLDTNTTNDLLKNVVSVLQDIYETSSTNVIQSAWSQITGMSIADLRSITNISDELLTQIGASHESWASSIEETRQQLLTSTTDTRIGTAELIQNLVNNALLDMGNNVTNSENVFESGPITNLLGLTGLPKYYLYYAGQQLGGTVGTIMQSMVTIPAAVSTLREISDQYHLFSGSPDILRNNAYVLQNILSGVSQDLTITQRGASSLLDSSGISSSAILPLLDSMGISSTEELYFSLQNLANQGYIQPSDISSYLRSFETRYTTSSNATNYANSPSLSRQAETLSQSVSTIVNESQEDRALLEQASDISSYLFENENTIRVTLAKIEQDAGDNLKLILNIQEHDQNLQTIKNRLYDKLDVDIVDNDMNRIVNNVYTAKWST